MRIHLSALVATLLGCQVVGGIDERSAASLPSEAPPATADGNRCEPSQQPTCEGDAPRRCEGARWVVAPVCAGEQPICAGGTCRANRSCASGKAGAGPSCGGASGTTDCCQSLVVEGGKFLRNYDGHGSAVVGPDGAPSTRILSYDDPSYPATLSNFRLDAFEVTVGRFRAFLAESGATQAHPPTKDAGAHPKAPKSGWDPEWNTRLSRDARELEAALSCGKQVDAPITWTREPGLYESHPMLCVDWYEAFAFCAWDGGRLPSDAELNFAASGGSEQRMFPWAGATISHDHAVYRCSDLGCLPAVGSKPMGRGRWGQFDLLGSAEEWVLDTYDLPQVPCNDCVATQDWASRLTRGGGYSSAEVLNMWSAFSAGQRAVQRLGMGFRCARDS